MVVDEYGRVSGIVTVSADRVAAIRATSGHYEALFGGHPSLDELREHYAMSSTTITDPDRLEKLGAFFFWTSWAAATNRPGTSVTYTNNWPHEPLVGNTATAGMGIWSVASIILLLAGIGAMASWHAARSHPDVTGEVPALTDLVIECREVTGKDGIRPRIMPARVQKMQSLSHDVMLLQLKLPSNERLQFMPGQYIEFLLKDGKRRAFSLANAPERLGGQLPPEPATRQPRQRERVPEYAPSVVGGRSRRAGDRDHDIVRVE